MARTKAVATLDSIAKKQLDAKEKFLKIVEGIKDVSEDFVKIKEEAELAKNELGYGLKAKEVEIKDAKNKLADELEVEKVKVADAIKLDNQKLIDLKEKQSKTIEELTYNHSLAVRDKNLKAAEAIGKMYKMSLVDSQTYIDLENRKVQDEAEITKLITNAEKKAKQIVYAEKGGEIKDLTNEKTLEIELLKKELELTKEALDNAKLTITEQKELIKTHPSEIQKALTASRMDLNQTFDRK